MTYANYRDYEHWEEKKQEKSERVNGWFDVDEEDVYGPPTMDGVDERAAFGPPPEEVAEHVEENPPW